MQLSIVRSLALILIFIQTNAFAVETSTLNSSVRALGMGDAFTAVANDSSSLFYNPAGLVRVRGINWKIFDVGVGASGASAYTKIKGLNSGSSTSGFASAVNNLYGEHVAIGAGGESIFTMPMFGFGIYNHTGTLIRVENPVYPQLHTNAISDYGYTMGVGIPVSPFLHLGLDLKYIKRTGALQDFGPGFVADLQPTQIVQNLTNWGTGYGADMGATAILPAGFFTAAMSVAWKNMGGMEFKSTNASTIPAEQNDISAGVALSFDTPIVSVTPALDFRYLNRTDLQLTRKINLGIEIGLPLLDIRGGFHEGYYTGGVGINLGLFRVDAATYGVELGDYPGQIEDRRYVLQFTMEIGIGNFSADGSTAAGGKGGKGANGTSSDSIWGGRRLKQRR